MANADKKIKTVDEKLSELKEKEKQLIAKEKSSYQKRLLDIGRLAAKANIDSLDSNILLGAFLEIASRMNDKECVSTWIKNSSNKEQEKKGNRFAVSFKEQPSNEVKELLKSLGFRWNSFRGEYFGIASAESLEEISKKAKCKIDSLG